MIDKSAYMLRISQAGPVQLVVINFELILEFLTAAKAAAVSATTSEDMDSFRANVQKAKNGLEELIQSLNFEASPLANDFYAIYDYAYKRLSDTHYTLDNAKAAEVTDEIIEIMSELLKGWQDAAAKTDDAPMAGEAPKVYSGLTYGRDGQANEYVDDGAGRGYMA